MALPTEAILHQLEQRLRWLQKKNHAYLNLASLPSQAHEQDPPKPKIQDTAEPPQEAFFPETPAWAPPADLEALKIAYAQCQRCPLGATRTRIVFGAGHPKSPLLFIGEGPGAEEDRLGEPFVGKAGKLLTKMVQAMGIDRPDIYIANIVKCRPPQNRNPHTEEIAQCFPIVQRQIELIDPQMIVTLGNVPTRALVPQAEGITKCRGTFYQYQGRTVLPTFHPAYLLRNPSAMELAWEDFKKIMNFCFEKTLSPEQTAP